MLLNLDDNQIGNDGIIEFAKAITPVTKYGSGALPGLRVLSLTNNGITGIGMTVFADACASGAMANLVKLDISHNNIGNAGIIALAKAIKPVTKNDILTTLELSTNSNNYI